MPAVEARENLNSKIKEKMPVIDAAEDKGITGEKIGEAAGKFTNTMNTILKHIVKVYGDDRNIIFSVISTIMDAVNNSVMGGLTGLESELEKIVNEEKAKGSGKPNAALDFLADCANFIRFFLEYLYYNKKLKIQKHLIKKMAEAKAELAAAQKEVDNPPNGDATKEVAAAAAVAAAVAAATEKIEALKKQQNEANDKASIRSATGEYDVLKRQNKRIEYLNNAFKHLVFTYGQLSGRTIYNIIQFLQNGPPAKVGYFDPISFGSLTNTMIRASPPGAIAGQVMDSVVDFGKAFINAGEASYVSLEKERELANEYMAYITEDTKNPISGQSGGKPKPSVEPKRIEKETFIKYYDSVKEKKGKKGKDKNYEERIKKLTGNKGRTNTNHNISQLTTGNIEKRIEDVRNAMTELNHVDNLKALLNDILPKSTRLSYQKRSSIYINSSSPNTKDNSKIALLTQDEVKQMGKTKKVREVFKKIIKNFDTNIDSPDKGKLDKLTIKKSNPQLYGIIMNFIRNNYKSAEDQVEELKNRIEKLRNISSKFDYKMYTEEEKKAKNVADKEKIPKLQELLILFKEVVVAEKEVVVAEKEKPEEKEVAEKEVEVAKKEVVVAKKEVVVANTYLNEEEKVVAEKELKEAEKKLVVAEKELKELKGAEKELKEAEKKLKEVVVKEKEAKPEENEVVEAKKEAEKKLVVAEKELKELEGAKKNAMNKAGGKNSVDDINNKLLELVALMELDADVIPKLRTKREWFDRMKKGNKTDKEAAKSEFRMDNAKIIDGENTDNEDVKDKEKLANITREIAKLTISVVAENKRTKSFMGEKKPKEGKAFLEEEYKLLLGQLNKVKEAERGELNSEIHNSGDFGRLASTYVNLKRGMADDINGLIKTVKADSIQEKDQENLEIVKSGLKKMLRFISNIEFGSINALFKRQKGGGNKTRRGGGDLSNIRRHIAKATRRIETTLNNFNNTRRNKRIKPRKTRRVNYGH